MIIDYVSGGVLCDTLAGTFIFAYFDFVLFTVLSPPSIFWYHNCLLCWR